MKKLAALCLAMLMVLSAVGAMAMTAGTYESAAQGFHGDVKLAVTVDVVAGASLTSGRIMKAVAECLNQAAK